ncbi:hypothetical protein [Nocardioides sp.]|uniref:hypothetical protein n=1 Tax=Nocardioides sp. TaxID=35761 RepID=UPI002CC0C0E4|nr:hypothetical protein [Nocardioides sp.]HXH80989.1 hypothetical protein [Nocardioides sp.]
MSRRNGCARLGIVAAAMVGAAVLTACGEREIGPPGTPIPEPVMEPTVSVEQAQRRYHPLAAAVVEAVGEVSAPGRSDGDPEVIYWDGRFESCTYASLDYEFDTVFGESTSWDDVRAAVAQVLEPEGFEVTEQLDIPGGNSGFDAFTDDGTRLQVRSKRGSPSTISLNAPVQGACDREGSQSLPPMPS